MKSYLGELFVEYLVEQPLAQPLVITTCMKRKKKH
jgi:hypothetical protein